MTLRQKTILYMCLMLVGLMAVMKLASSRLLYPELGKIEEKLGRENIENVRGFFEDESDRLVETVQHWASFDELIAGIIQGNQAAADEYFSQQAIKDLGIDFVVIVSETGRIFYQRSIHQKLKIRATIPQGLRKYIQPGSSLLTHTGKETGIVSMLGTPSLLVSSRPVTTALPNNLKLSVIAGYCLDDVFAQRLARLSGLTLRMIGYNDINLPSDFRIAQAQLSPTMPILNRLANPDIVASYTYFPDLFDAPGLIIRVDTPRIVPQNHMKKAMNLVTWLLVGGLLLGVAALSFIERSVLSRVGYFLTKLNHIRLTKDISGRLNVEGRDEISQLGRAINSTLEALDNAQKKQKKAEIALADEKERLALTLKSITDAVITTDINGYIALMNPIAEHLTGWPLPEAAGRYFTDVFFLLDPESREKRTDCMKERATRHSLLVDRSGKQVPVVEHGSPLYDKDNILTGMILVFRGASYDENKRSEAPAHAGESGEANPAPPASSKKST